MFSVRPLEVTIPLEPRGKGRPRFARRGRYVSTYTDDKTAAWEAEAAAHIVAAAEQCGWPYLVGVPVLVEVFAYYRRPKKRLPPDAVPLRKPDIDNVAKIVLDSMVGTGRVIDDDAQVVRLLASKAYAPEGVEPYVQLQVSML